MSDGAILIRADASAAIGMGHLMRCLALAEVCGTRATFLTSEPPEGFVARATVTGAVLRRLAAPPGSAADLRETAAVARMRDAEWIVLDGYGFDGDFQAGLVADGHYVLAVDDHGHAGRYEAQLVLNPDAGADASFYEDRAPETRLLLGLRYALLRAEFRTWTSERRAVPPRARRVLITFGGSDPDNLSARALAALTQVPGPLEIGLVVGAANPREAQLRAQAAGCPHPVQIAVDVTDMAPWLAHGDLALTAAGGTLTELARVGTPAIAIVVADNQAPGARALARAGAAIDLGWHTGLDGDTIAAAVSMLADDPGRRESLSAKGRELVDGQGAVRVLAQMRETSAPRPGAAAR